MKSVVWRRVIAVLFVCSLLVLMLPAFAAESAEFPNPRVVTDRPLEVAYCRSTLGWASGIRPYTQLHIEEQIRGWNITYVTDIEIVAKQREAVENLIVKDVDAIIIDNFQIHQMPDLVAAARQKGIGVYCLDTPVIDGVIAETTMANGIFSAQMAYWGLDKTQGKGGVGLIAWETTDWGVERGFPFRVLIDECFPGLELLEYFTPNVERYVDDCFQATAAWVQKHGTNLRWINTPFDGIALPVTRAVEQAGYTRDQIMVTGIDAGIEACQLIKEGTPMAATYGQFFEAYAHYICEVIDQVQIKGIMPDDPESMIPEGKVLRFGGMLIDETNVPEEGQTAYDLHEYDGLDPNDPEAWVNWYKKTDVTPYIYNYPTN